MVRKEPVKRSGWADYRYVKCSPWRQLEQSLITLLCSTHRSRGNSSSASSPHYGFRIVRELAVPVTTVGVMPQSAVSAPSSSKLFIHDPAFPAWIAEVQAMTAEEQIEAVSKKLVELNPGFEKDLRPFFKGKSIVGVEIVSDVLTDLSPLRALVNLQQVSCAGRTPGQAKYLTFHH